MIKKEQKKKMQTRSIKQYNFETWNLEIIKKRRKITQKCLLIKLSTQFWYGQNVMESQSVADT